MRRSEMLFGFALGVVPRVACFAQAFFVATADLLRRLVQAQRQTLSPTMESLVGGDARRVPLSQQVLPAFLVLPRQALSLGTKLTPPPGVVCGRPAAFSRCTRFFLGRRRFGILIRVR